ncbi:zinc finger MYM-type protein 1-like [Aphis craccivora]|uniref:Zinc finger MYM-type protein 1-like n=1 Tax=Aphis craccivora TaxID=307492 RepID=A0A6G0VVR8_APHCR|nr:zinc finger MYM-type protein 1-like [Aphis craccivora]
MFSLSVPQVGCKRSFSKLKYIINYLRNISNQDILESFI